MKLSTATAAILLAGCSSFGAVAFAPTTSIRLAAAARQLHGKTASTTAQQTTTATTTTVLHMGLDLSGNTWKPESEKMGSTDTGDYFPDDYSADVGFADGMMGSQAGMGGDRKGPQLPGMENLGADAIVTGGIETASEIPPGMEFTPSSVPDGEYAMQVAGSGSAGRLDIMVKPVCMTFEDYYAGFSPDSHPAFSVAPVTGRMDRRGGEASPMTIICDPKGQSGTLTGSLVINLPEDNSKICFKVTAQCF
jgi:hypothetical protein